MSGQSATLKPDELFPWLEHVAQALDFIHEEGHVHRDVKPSNILYDGHGNVYLSDFGIAKALGQVGESQQATPLTSTGAVPGTPEYIAPEVFMGQQYDGRADQYALTEVVDGNLPDCSRVDEPRASPVATGASIA